MLFFCKQYGLDDGALDFTGIGLDEEKFKIFSGVYVQMLANGFDGFEKIMKTSLGLAYIEVMRQTNEKKKEVEEANIKPWISNFNDCYEEHKEEISG